MVEIATFGFQSPLWYTAITPKREVKKMVIPRENPFSEHWEMKKSWREFMQEIKQEAEIRTMLEGIGIEEGAKEITYIHIQHLEDVPEKFFDRKPALWKEKFPDGSSKVGRQTECYIFSPEGCFLRMVNTEHTRTQGDTTTVLQEGKSVGEKLKEIDNDPTIILWTHWLHPENENEGIMINVEVAIILTQPQS